MVRVPFLSVSLSKPQLGSPLGLPRARVASDEGTYVSDRRRQEHLLWL